MKRVALFTTFFEAESGYSLIAVAGTQLQALIDHGYDPAVLVQENFTEAEPPSLWRDEQLDLRRVIPFMHLNTGVDDDFEQRVGSIVAGLREGLADVDVCITHDIILQDWYKEHNVAMRRYADERPDLLWLHWIHSCPTPKDVTTYPEGSRYTPPPGYVIYPNASDKSLRVLNGSFRAGSLPVPFSRAVTWAAESPASSDLVSTASTPRVSAGSTPTRSDRFVV